MSFNPLSGKGNLCLNRNLCNKAPLGDYRSNHFPYLAWFEDDRVTEDNGPLAEFRQALIDVEAIINARNSERISYNFLLPSQIPTSINI